MQKYFIISQYDDEDDDYRSFGPTLYKDEESAIKAAQKKADERKADVQVLVACKNVKYPTPTYPVEAIS